MNYHSADSRLNVSTFSEKASRQEQGTRISEGGGLMKKSTSERPLPSPVEGEEEKGIACLRLRRLDRRHQLGQRLLGVAE